MDVFIVTHRMNLYILPINCGLDPTMVQVDEIGFVYNEACVCRFFADKISFINDEQIKIVS